MAMLLETIPPDFASSHPPFMLVIMPWIGIWSKNGITRHIRYSWLMDVPFSLFPFFSFLIVHKCENSGVLTHGNVFP
jgi:hypothetical protein